MLSSSDFAITDIDECASTPCMNGATCQDWTNMFTCQCAVGYYDTLCDLDFDECESNPCIHGTCNDEIGTYSCDCETGYTGQSCELGKQHSDGISLQFY